MATPYTSVKDSGERQSFESGSVRDSAEGKGRYDLLSPIFLTRLAQHTENGARKYSCRNWEKGQPVSRFLDSALRHLFKYLEGHRDEDHLAAAAWNIQGMIHTEEAVSRGLLPSELAELPSYVEDGKAAKATSHDPGPFRKPEPWLPDLPLGWVYSEIRPVREGEAFLVDSETEATWNAHHAAHLAHPLDIQRASGYWKWILGCTRAVVEWRP